jgi:MarR family transcriptional regulator, organic hydroperoxide resistance regulator
MSKRKTIALLAQEIDQHLRAVRQALRRPVEAEFAKGGLTGPQRTVMHALVHSGGLSLKELSRQVGLAHSTVSGIVDRLEKQGLVERRTDSRDRRATMIQASPRVRNYVRNILPGLEIHPIEEALGRAKPSERIAILEGLRILRRLASPHSQQLPP